jgi:hypothetical protein
MRRLIGAVALSVFAAGLAVPAAQQASTIVLKSGELINGDLVDLGAGGFTIRTAGQEREIPSGNVSTIDFGMGPLDPVPDAARTLAAGSTLVVLKSGEQVVGQFYDIGGTQPLRLTLRTASGERAISSSDVRLIYMQPVGGGEQVGVTPPAGGGTAVTVSARTAWTNTGLTVTRGQTLRFESSGEIVFSPRGHVARPAGSVDGLRDSGAPLPSVSQGALIGRVGGVARGRGASGGQVFQIGDQTSVVMPADGTLYLGVNDSGLDDNRGNFSVRIGQ